MSAPHVLVLGSGSAALCAGIAALEGGARVTALEKATPEQAGGNSRYTAGAMRFAYDDGAQLHRLLLDPADARLAQTDFGAYPAEQFATDLLGFNDGRPLSAHQRILIDESYATVAWLAEHHVRFEPIYERQSFLKNGRHVFWGGLTLAAQGEGVGLVDAELAEFERLGGEIRYGHEGLSLLLDDDGEAAAVRGLRCRVDGAEVDLEADAVVLASGGFEASPALRARYMGERWASAKVRGTPHNTGAGIEMALAAGGALHGVRDGCHATPMDRDMPDYGNLDIPHLDRKLYRKICYFLGVMLNARGARFVDEGANFRNYTYAQFGREILHQPGGVAFQFFDAKVLDLLYGEYRFRDATYVEADTLGALVAQLDGIDRDAALATLRAYNDAVDEATPFDPTVLDGRGTAGLTPPKSNWANRLDTPPYRAYPVTCGITFTYAGLHVDASAAVLRADGAAIPGLYACGELVGGVFYDGYPGGSGLTSGAVFGRLAGTAAAAARVPEAVGV